MSEIVILRSNPVMPDPRVEKVARVIISRGHSIGILCWDRSRSATNVIQEIKKSFKVNRICIKSSYGSGFYSNLIAMARFQLSMLRWLILNKNEYRHIYACDLDTAIVALIVSKITRRRYVYDIFDYYPDAFKLPAVVRFVVRRIDRIVMNNSSAVIICSDQRKRQLGATPNSPLYVVHNTPDARCQPPVEEWERKLGFLVISYVGVLTNDRRIDWLLNIVEDNKNIELHIAGFGVLESLVSQYSERCPRITFYGCVDYTTALKIQGRSDVMWAAYNPDIPNHRYAAPNKFYESLMLGKHLLMLRNTGMDAEMIKYEFGTVVDDDYKAIQMAIISLRDGSLVIDSPSYLREIYDNYFSWTKSEKALSDAISCLFVKEPLNKSLR